MRRAPTIQCNPWRLSERFSWWAAILIGLRLGVSDLLRSSICRQRRCMGDLTNRNFRYSCVVDPAGTIDVLETHRFDIKALERYVSGRLAGLTPPITVRQFHGGQSNPTYYIRGAGSGADLPASPQPRSREGGPGPREYVLRRKPPGQLLPSAHAIDREYRVMTA